MGIFDGDSRIVGVHVADLCDESMSDADCAYARKWSPDRASIAVDVGSIYDLVRQYKYADPMLPQ